MKGVILGAGMSGLILAEVFAQNGVYEDIEIYTRDALGQHALDFDLGPRILHKTNKVEKFLYNLFGNDEYKKYEREYKIGVVDRGCLLSNSADYSQIYAKKLNKDVESSTMSAGKRTIIGYDITKMNLPNILYNKYKDKMQLAEISRKFLEERNLVWCNLEKEIYSTIPYEVMNKMFYMYEPEQTLEYEIFVWFDKQFDWPSLDYVYDITENNSVKRITKLDKGCVYEFVGVSPKTVQEIADMSSKGHKILGMDIRKVIITKSRPIHFIMGIELVGRFATNNHSERMDTIIEKYLME